MNDNREHKVRAVIERIVSDEGPRAVTVARVRQEAGVDQHLAARTVRTWRETLTTRGSGRPLVLSAAEEAALAAMRAAARRTIEAEYEARLTLLQERIEELETELAAARRD